MVDQKVFDKQMKGIIIFLAVSFLGLGYVLTRLPGINPPPDGKQLSDRTCITGTWKLLLVLTHILIFVIIPIAMKVFYTSMLAARYPASAIFATQLGLALVMVSIAAEIGWHVTQCWYYSNDFSILNFMFYFFTLSAFALWADGLVREPTPTTALLNVVFAVLLFLVSIMYPIGFAVEDSAFKIPIYIALTVIFAVLAWRAYLFLDDWRIVFFPILSVGVNLFFVSLLQRYGGDPYFSPRVVPNALFHILHDLLGTEAGVVVFTVLVYLKGRNLACDEQVPLVA